VLKCRKIWKERRFCSYFTKNILAKGR